MRRFTWVPFAVALFAFVLPFATVSCDELRVEPSGAELVLRAPPETEGPNEEGVELGELVVEFGGGWRPRRSSPSPWHSWLLCEAGARAGCRFAVWSGSPRSHSSRRARVAPQQVGLSTWTRASARCSPPGLPRSAPSPEP